MFVSQSLHFIPSLGTVGIHSKAHVDDEPHQANNKKEIKENVSLCFLLNWIPLKKSWMVL